MTPDETFTNGVVTVSHALVFPRAFGTMICETSF